MLTLALAFFLLAPLPQWGREVRQPTQQTSANGACVLHVDPSDPTGTGPMHCKLMRGKEVAWERDIDWTFEEASVADDGTVVGYSNLDGKPVDALRILVLDAKGDVRRQHDVAYESALMHGPSLPCASGRVLIHDREDLALLRVHPADQSRPSPWRSLKLSTGEFAGEVTPTCPGSRGEHQYVHERDARVIGDSGLILCQWLYADYRPVDLEWSQNGAIFNLVNLKGESVWGIQWLDDYTDRKDKQADERLEYELRQRSPILSTGPGNRFALRHVRPNQRVEFAVEKDASAPEGWSVIEVSRTPFEPVTPKSKPAQALALKQLAVVAIGAAPTASNSPIHDVDTIGFSDTGAIEIMRYERSKGLSFARLRESGELEFERDLSALLLAMDAWPTCFDLSGDRWLIQLTGTTPPWHEIDVKTGTSRPSPLPEGGMDCGIVAMPDGGYLALVPRIVNSLAFTELDLVLGDGSLAWSEQVQGIGPDETDFQKAIYFSNGLVAAGENQFALVGMDELSIINLEKQLLRKTPLAAVIGHEPIYVSDVLPDRRGGLWFHEGDRFWHADELGNPAGSLVPRRADGSQTPAFDGNLRAAPDGRLWTSDGARLYRLADSGLADLVLGPTQLDDELAEADDASIDAHGRVLVRDRFTQALHAFDSKGTKLFVAKLRPEERSSDSLFESFLALPDGSIWLEVRQGLIHISAKGERIGAPLDLTEETSDGVDGLDDFDPIPKLFESIQRRPDGKFLEGVSGRALLKDGRRVLCADSDESGGASMLYFYSPANIAVASIELPGDTPTGEIRASERWLVLGSYGPTWTLVRLKDQQVFRFDSGLADGGNWHSGLTPDGRVLLLLNANRRELVRFELP